MIIMHSVCGVVTHLTHFLVKGGNDLYKICVGLISEFVLTSQNFASASWRPLQHADHVFIVLDNSKAWLVPALICCLATIPLSSHCFYHSFLLSVSARKLDSPREQNSFKNVYRLSTTLTAGSLIAECGGAQKLRGSKVLEERIAALVQVFGWICGFEDLWCSLFFLSDLIEHIYGYQTSAIYNFSKSILVIWQKICLWTTESWV